MAQYYTFKVEFPDEPPVGSVVLDSDDRVWQRNKVPGNEEYQNQQGNGGWQMVIGYDFMPRSLSWPVLLALHGELRLLHRAEEVKA